MDAEELEQYNYAVLTSIAFNDPKQLNNWKWSSRDQAGTLESNNTSVVQNALESFGSKVLKLDMGLAKSRVKKDPTRLIEFARITGRKITLRNPDGFLFDEETKLVRDYDPQSILIDVDYEGNFI